MAETRRAVPLTLNPSPEGEGLASLQISPLLLCCSGFAIPNLEAGGL
jgi:hypothetical protein